MRRAAESVYRGQTRRKGERIRRRRTVDFDIIAIGNHLTCIDCSMANAGPNTLENLSV